MKNKKRSPQSCIELRFTRDPQKGHLPVNEAASSLTVPETSRSPLDHALTVQHLCSGCCHQLEVDGAKEHGGLPGVAAV
ncbi:uncharacterized protein LOC144037813 isoform X2 [Vanacampus margaritifer]